MPRRLESKIISAYDLDMHSFSHYIQGSAYNYWDYKNSLIHLNSSCLGKLLEWRREHPQEISERAGPKDQWPVKL